MHQGESCRATKVSLCTSYRGRSCYKAKKQAKKMNCQPGDSREEIPPGAGHLGASDAKLKSASTLVLVQREEAKKTSFYIASDEGRLQCQLNTATVCTLHCIAKACLKQVHIASGQ